MHDSRATRSMRVTTDGKNLVPHAGTALLSELADRSGLTDAMSVAMSACGINWHTHDPGVVLTHLAVAIADGADCLADLAALREQSELFGPVASVATAWRAVEATTAFELRAIPEAIAAARARVWAAAPPGESLVLDFDATLVNSYSEKQDATPTYKKGFGFFPLGVWCDTTNEPLAAMLRPGNSGANDAEDHITLFHSALSGLPEEYQTGHFENDHPALVEHPILVRADSAGATHRFVDAIVGANCDFSIGYPVDQGVRQALVLVQEEDWIPAKETDGSVRDGAWVTELTDLIPLSAWPEDTRLIMRRERPHPGAQLTLFDTAEGFRHTCFITNTEGTGVASPRAPPPGTRPGGGPDQELEGLRPRQPALRLLRAQRGVGGNLPHRRSTAGLEPDGLLRRCTGQGRAEDHALPGPPRGRHSSSTRAEDSSSAWTRPGRGSMTSPTPSSDSGQPSLDDPGHNARPESRPAGRDIRTRMTTPRPCTPKSRSQCPSRS